MSATDSDGSRPVIPIHFGHPSQVIFEQSFAGELKLLAVSCTSFNHSGEVQMPAERITMRKIREVLRLKFECRLSNRKIARSTSVARSTASDYIQRSKAAGLDWPLPEDMDDAQLEKILFDQVSRTPTDQRPPFNFSIPIRSSSVR